MKYCIKCGNKLKPLTKFCTFCGNQLALSRKEGAGSIFFGNNKYSKFDVSNYKKIIYKYISSFIKLPKIYIPIILSSAALIFIVLFKGFNSVPECSDSGVLATVESLSQQLIRKKHVQDQLDIMNNRRRESVNFLNSLGGSFGSAARSGFLFNGGTRQLSESDVPEFTIQISNISLITEEMFDDKTNKRVCQAKVTSSVISDKKQSDMETYVEYDIQPDESSDGGNVISLRMK